MRSLGGRLKALETHFKPVANVSVCPRCGGLGEVKVILPETPETPIGPCPICRREPTVIRVEYVEMDMNMKPL